MRGVMRGASAASVFVAILAVATPGLAKEWHEQVKSGKPLPEGKTLLIGRVVLSPPLPSEPFADDYEVSLTFDRSQPIKFGKKLGTRVKADEKLYLAYDKTSFNAITPGTRLIRLMNLTQALGPPIFRMGHAMIEHSKATVLDLIADVKITVPKGAKAVYIGTLVYHREGNRVTRVQVRDDQAQAMADFAKMKVPGVRRQDVVKRLAQVVP